MKKSIEKLSGLMIAFMFCMSFISVAQSVFAQDLSQSPRILKCVVSDNSLVNGYGKTIKYYAQVSNADKLDPYPYSYDGGNTWSDSPDFEVRNNGMQKVCLKNADGDISEYEFYEDHIDNSSPYIESMEYVFDEICNDYGRYVKVNLTIRDDGAGVADFPISYDGKEYVSKLSRTYYVNGTYQVLLKDRLGNEEAKDIVIDCIDSKGPQIIDKGIRGGVSSNGYCYDAELYVVCADTQSGLAAKAFSFDGGYSFSSINQATVRENGEYKIVVRDGLNNETTDSISVTGIDNEAPVLKAANLELDDGKNGYGSAGTLYLEAEDNESGLADLPYSFDGGNTYVEENSIKTNSNGIVNVCILDKVGNVASEQIPITQIDTTPPSIVVSGNPTVIVNTDVTLKVSLSDPNSGIAALYFKNKQSGREVKLFSANGENSKTDTVVVNQNGNYEFRALDCAGNESVKTIKVSKIDKTASKSSSSSMGRVVIGNTGTSKSSSVIKAITIGNENEEMVTTKTFSKDITPTETKEDEVSVMEDVKEEEDFAFDVSQNPMVPVVTMPEQTEVISVAEDNEENLSDAPKLDLSVEYPEEKSEDNSKNIVAAAIFGVLLMLSVLIVILYKSGLIKKISIFKDKEEE